MSFTTAATSSGDASGLTALRVRMLDLGTRGRVETVLTNFELTLNALPILLTVIPLHGLVVL